jgi:hypothetical protein
MAALLAALAFLTACGGDDDDDNSNGGTPSADATQGADSGDNGGSEGDGDGSPSEDTGDLVDVATKFSESTFRGDYEFVGAPGDDLSEGTLVMYKSGTDKLRFDLSAEQEGETVEIILIETPDASAFCLKNAGEFGLLLGVPEGEGVCFNDDPTAGEGAAFSDIIAEIEAGDWEVIDRSERDIAGENADCYQTRNAAGEESTVCFNDDGYLLATTDPDGSSLEANSVSGDVSDSDFDTPYEIRELPDIGGEE